MLNILWITAFFKKKKNNFFKFGEFHFCNFLLLKNSTLFGTSQSGISNWLSHKHKQTLTEERKKETKRIEKIDWNKEMNVIHRYCFSMEAKKQRNGLRHLEYFYDGRWTCCMRHHYVCSRKERKKERKKEKKIRG